MRRTVGIVLRLIVGGIFLYAAYDKVIHPGQFAEILMDYEALPLGAVNLVALWLPMLEVMVGLALIVGLWVRANALLASGLMAVFIVGIAQALGRGVGLHCGCFSTSPGGEARTWISLWEEGLLVGGCVALWVLRWPTIRSLSIEQHRRAP
jgi:uncharacterized membrane protein YphA (DoxX/SURF4 family)